MRCSQAVLIAVACVTLGTGCATPAPGAADVRLTKNPADVVGCRLLGNIRVDDSDVGSDSLFRKQVMGLGGNTGLVTATTGLLPPTPSEGVAYLCPQMGL